MSVSSDDDTLVRAQEVPAQFLPMILESGCRTGVNAGGADKGGSGALGASWMTNRCWAMTTAINFLAMGAYEEACELFVDINRDQYRRIHKKPDCAALAARLIAADAARMESVDAIDLTDYPKRSEVNQAIDRAFKSTVSK